MAEESGKGRERARRSPIGAPPGTLTAHAAAEPTVLNLTLVRPGGGEFHPGATLADVEGAKERWPLLWLDCVGLADVELIGRIGALFGLHPLALEDAVNIGQRPKADAYDGNIFVVMSVIDEVGSRRREQISLAFGEGFVVSFQERPGDPFEPVRRRIKGGSPLCSRRGDYLAYALIDAMVDSYFPVVDGIGETIDGIEDVVFAGGASKERLRDLYTLRRAVAGLKRTLWPLRDALAGLVRSENALITQETKTYLNDTLDHAVRLIETVEGHRDTLTGLIDIDLSLAQEQTNEVVGFLTIVSSIFIPLTFLAGIWGMNFDPDASPWNMPELRAWYGYPAALLLMAAVALVLVLYFRRKKWL